MRRRASFNILESLASFSRHAAPRLLRPYQLEAGETIIRSVMRGEGRTFTVLMARQSGKNELSAQLEAYLLHLFADRGGQIVKAAPSYHPQIVNSVIRLRETLSTPFSDGRWTSRHGHSIEVGKARIMFFSADPIANVVGATASILLEIDEAQDIDADVYWRSFRPMASTTNATTVLYGTAWDEDNLLEQQRRFNRRVEADSGLRLNFESPWNVLGRTSTAYRSFVESEIARLGPDHPIIRTQFLLEPVTSAGRLFSAEALDSMHGDHHRQLTPIAGSTYVAGVDIAGQVVDPTLESRAHILNRSDDTVITIAEVDASSGGPPAIRLVRHIRWRGLTHTDQYDRILHLFQNTWPVAKVSVDATGIGAGIASFLSRSLGERLDPVVFGSRVKSELGFRLLAAAETGRLTIYSGDGPDERELWKQFREVRYALTGEETLEFSAGPGGHDDYVLSVALAVRAAESLSPPAFGGLIRARPSPDETSGW